MSTEPSSGQPQQPASSPAGDRIAFDDFAKVQMRVGKVVEATNHPNADKLIILKVDLGTEQRQLCAGLRGYYEAEDLVGRLIVVVMNLAPRKMRGVESDGMLLAASSPDHSRVILLTPEAALEPGAVVS